MKTPDPSLELAARIYAYRESGESWTEAVDAFARAVLMRHPRTVHRWLAGESPVPKAVAAWIMDGTPRLQDDIANQPELMTSEQLAASYLFPGNVEAEP